MPRLKDGGTTVRFEASGQAVVSAGPNVPQAQAHVVDGKFGTPNVTLELAAPRGSQAVAVYAAAHILSSNPPRPDIKYQIEFSTDGGKTWKPIVKDWTDHAPRRRAEGLLVAEPVLGPGRSADRDDGAGARPLPQQRRQGITPGREAHLVYKTGEDRTKVTFAWTDAAGPHTESHVYAGAEPWTLPTGRNVKTKWVEFEAVKQ